MLLCTREMSGDEETTMNVRCPWNLKSTELNELMHEMKSKERNQG